MPPLLKTEAIVLRSIRYGEADRIVHLYTPDDGRVGAIAKGARRSRSRFGARLEPFFHIHVLLHDGRGDLYTVTSADTISAHRALRDHAATLDAAARACDAVSRLFETSDPHPEVFRLLANELGLLNDDVAHARSANGLAFRLKLLLAAGILPQLGSCAGCGESEHLRGFSAAAGGVVCSACEAAAFPIGEESYSFMISALARPLAQAPDASELALRQAERAIAETAEHHAHVRLRPLLRALGDRRSGQRQPPAQDDRRRRPAEDDHGGQPAEDDRRRRPAEDGHGGQPAENDHGGQPAAPLTSNAAPAANPSQPQPMFGGT